MIELQANMWSVPADAHVITTNGSVRRDGACVMGRGCALEARNMFPPVDTLLGQYIKLKGNHVHLLGNWACQKVLYQLVSFPVKRKWSDRASFELIEQSVHELVALTDKMNWRKVVVPRVGCGNGGLRWDGTDNVREFVAPLFDDRFVVVHK